MGKTPFSSEDKGAVLDRDCHKNITDGLGIAGTGVAPAVKTTWAGMEISQVCGRILFPILLKAQ